MSQIVFANGKYVKAFCEGFLDAEDEVCLKISGICEDSEVTIIEEELHHDVLFGITKVIFIKGVIPMETPLKLIKTFSDFCRICIFPFLAFVNENHNASQSESGISNFE